MKPIIYQLFPRLYTNTKTRLVKNGTISQNGVGKMNDLTEKVLKDIKNLGVTHIWLTGVIEHATTTDYSEYNIRQDHPSVVKGNAGSPYAIKDYYDIDPDIATNVENRITEFEELVKRIHKEKLKVVIDFVPNHVSRQYHSDIKLKGVEDFGAGDKTDWFFARDNNYYYLNNKLEINGVNLNGYEENPAKATGNDCFSPTPNKTDWYETVKLNYGIDYSDNSRHFEPIPDTWKKMSHILKYWTKKGIDAFRCDMVFMVPLEFWKWVIPQIKAVKKSILFIAEIYDTNLYRQFIDAGFDFLYDKVNLYDTLFGIERYGWNADAITHCWQKIDGLGDRMLNFIENHDELRFASSFYSNKAENIFPSLVVSLMLGKGAFMLYQGQELGEKGEDVEGYSGFDGRTTIFDYWSMKSVRNYLIGKSTKKELALREKYAKILNLCHKYKSISDGDFYDLTYVNYNSDTYSTQRQFSFLRYHKGELSVIAVNFDDKPVKVGISIPTHAFEHFNIIEGTYNFEELLSGKEEKKELSGQEKFHTTIGAKNAAIWHTKL